MAMPRLPKPFNFELLSQEYIASLEARFERNSEEINNCLIWNKATNSSGYPQTKIKDPVTGKSGTMSVHRFVYGLRSGDKLDKHDHQVSHICHNKLCIRFEHLCYETPSNNIQRKECLKKGACDHHGNQPDCIINP
jgi:hypothetical protein